MDQRIKKFDDKETKVFKFHQYKSLISINGIDINSSI